MSPGDLEVASLSVGGMTWNLVSFDGGERKVDGST